MPAMTKINFGFREPPRHRRKFPWFKTNYHGDPIAWFVWKVKNWEQHYPFEPASFKSMKKKNVTFTIKKSKEDGGFFCSVTHGSREITFSTETHKNHGDVTELLMSHIEAIREGRYKVVDSHIGPVCTGKRCAKKK